MRETRPMSGNVRAWQPQHLPPIEARLHLLSQQDMSRNGHRRGPYGYGRKVCFALLPHSIRIVGMGTDICHVEYGDKCVLPIQAADRSTASHVVTCMRPGCGRHCSIKDGPGRGVRQQSSFWGCLGGGLIWRERQLAGSRCPMPCWRALLARCSCPVSPPVGSACHSSNAHQKFTKRKSQTLVMQGFMSLRVWISTRKAGRRSM